MVYVVLAATTLILLYLISIIYYRNARNLDTRNKQLLALRKMDEIMMASLSLQDVAQRVTDAIAFELKFEIGVLSLLDEKARVLRRVAMSRTQVGLETHKYLPIPYNEIVIPLSQTDNLLVKTITDGQRRSTHRLYDVFLPALDENTALKIQKTIGIKTSLIYPVFGKGKPIGAMIFSLKRDEKDISEYELDMIKKLVDVMGIALSNAQVYQQLRDTTIQLEQANDKLKQLDKLKDDFVSIASHELRTPMTAIRSYAWMALYRSDTPLSEKMKKYLSRTLISTERLINLVNDMLNISRIESGSIPISPIPFDIISLTKDVCLEVVAKAKEKNIRLEVVETHIPKVFADADKVHQILLNLIGNAMKFTPEHGSITMSFFSDGETVEVSVKDTGVGISPDDLSRLFQKFGRLDNSYVAAATSGGTGLGLYISKILVSLMQGKIWVKSEGRGKGTTFTFSLPAAIPKNLEHPEKYTRTATGEAKTLEPAAV